MATGTDFWAGSDMCKHESICVSMNMNKKILPALLLAVCCWAGASAQQVAVKTNLLYWAAATPNVGAEVAVGKHSTLGFSANYNPWTIGSDNKIQHWFIRPEYRYWVTEKYTRLFFGVHAIGGKFEVGGFKLPFIGDKVFKGLQTNYYKGSFVGASARRVCGTRTWRCSGGTESNFRFRFQTAISAHPPFSISETPIRA